MSKFLKALKNKSFLKQIIPQSSNMQTLQIYLHFYMPLAHNLFSHLLETVDSPCFFRLLKAHPRKYSFMKISNYMDLLFDKNNFILVKQVTQLKQNKTKPKNDIINTLTITIKLIMKFLIIITQRAPLPTNIESLTQ